MPSRTERIALAALIALIGGVAIHQAMPYPPRARLVPLVAAVPTTIGSLLLIAKELLAMDIRRQANGGGRGASTTSARPAVASARMIEPLSPLLLAWPLIYVIAAALFGMLIGTALVVPLIALNLRRERPRTLIALVLGTTTFLLGVRAVFDIRLLDATLF